MKIISKRTQGFKKLFDKLPNEIQVQAKYVFESWKKNPSSLHIKPLESLQQEAFSAEINHRYRVLGFKKKDDNNQTIYAWFWVGSHEDYNKIIMQNEVSKKIRKMREQIPKNNSNNKIKCSI